MESKLNLLFREVEIKNVLLVRISTKSNQRTLSKSPNKAENPQMGRVGKLIRRVFGNNNSRQLIRLWIAEAGSHPSQRCGWRLTKLPSIEITASFSIKESSIGYGMFAVSRALNSFKNRGVVLFFAYLVLWDECPYSLCLGKIVRVTKVCWNLY